MSDNKIKTRFAPSPTGSVHVGNARSALYEYLYAKKNNGEFILRIEDTDQKRYDEAAIQKIYEMLDWFGLKYDGEVLIQSSRITIYKKFAEELVEKGLAYYCFCSEERLTKLREEQIKANRPTGYDKKCRNLTASEVSEKIQNGEQCVIRLKMPESGKIKFTDLVRGEIEFDYALVDDQVLLKADGYPTYHLASVVDDHEQSITHVIRAEEWLSSVPKHLYLYHCFGWEVPAFAHLSMILGKDKKKLSKREGATSVEEFRELGYLSEALLNFIALLGWNPGTEKEFFTLKELEKEFDLAHVNKSPAMFDIEKLNHFNAHYIHQMEGGELLDKIRPYSKLDFSKIEHSFLEKIIKVVKQRIVLLTDFDNLTSYFFNDIVVDKEMIKFSKSEWPDTIKGLEKTIESLEMVDKNKMESAEELNLFLSQVASVNGLKNGDVFWPVRAGLSGEMASPSPSELIWVLGYEESLKRLKNALNIIK
jgi:glutamyl-tRNA synthetase